MNALSPAKLLATTSISTPVVDDAELLTAFSTFLEAEAALYRLGIDAADDVHRAAMDRYHDAYQAVDEITAHTLVGLQAKARVVKSGLKMQEGNDEDLDDTAEWQIRGAWNLLRDVEALRLPTILPDGDLIASCSEFLRIQREFDTYSNTFPDGVEADDPGLAMLDPVPALVERIVGLRAITAEGHLARARCIAFPYLPQFRGCRDDPKMAPEDRFKAAERRDLVAMERGAVTPVALPHPDAELLDACAAFDALERAYIATSGEWSAGSPEALASDAERRQIVAAQGPLVERICELRAVTRDGLVARARSLALWEGDDPLGDIDGSQVNERLLGAVLRDLLAGSAAA